MGVEGLLNRIYRAVLCSIHLKGSLWGVEKMSGSDVIKKLKWDKIRIIVVVSTDQRRIC